MPHSSFNQATSAAALAGDPGPTPLVGADCLARWRANSRSGSMDVVLITHPRDEHDLPRLFPGTAALSAADRRSVTRHLKPIFGEVIFAGRLTVGILFLPIYADQVIDPRERKCSREMLEKDGLDAVSRVARRDTVICLGGLTGSLSNYGLKIEGRASELGLRLTTGHSATAISVLRTYLQAVRELAISPASSTMALLGVGSVGGAFAELLSAQDQLPGRLVLIDRPARRGHLEEMASRLSRTGRMAVGVECTTAAGQVEADSAAYRCTFLITAVSTPYLIDPDRVAPGTVLVDDSQPYCWDRTRAWGRVLTRGDIAPCEAGLVDATAIGYRAHFPFDFADHGPDGSTTSWSCLAEGLLRGLQPDLPATLGEPTRETLFEYANAFQTHGFATPPLQCGPHVLPIGDLRRQFQAV